MFAVVEEIGSQVKVQVAVMPRDTARVIDSTAFLKALQGGPPAAEKAFRDLDIHLRAPLLRFISRWFRDTVTAEDLVQETFLAVYEGLPAFAGSSGLIAWVYSLAYAKVKIRLLQKYSCDLRSEEDCAPVLEAEAADPSPEEAAHKSLLVALIRSAAEMIPAHYRVVWNLCDVERMSGEDAANTLGIAPALVRVRLHRARGLITAQL